MNKANARKSLRRRAERLRESVLDRFPELAEDMDTAVEAIDHWEPSDQRPNPLSMFMSKAFAMAVDAGMIQTAPERKQVLSNDLKRMHKVFSEAFDVNFGVIFDEAKALIDDSPCLSCGVGRSVRHYVEAAIEVACKAGKKVKFNSLVSKVGSRYVNYMRGVLMERQSVLSDEIERKMSELSADDEDFFVKYLTKEEYEARQDICSGCEFLKGSRCTKFCSCSGDVHASRQRSVRCPEGKW